MRVQTEEWRRFIPGSRMYKGKKTLFYNGEILFNRENDEYLIYSEEEQNSWEVIIILPGVEVIPTVTFSALEKLETVIMSDTVRRIEDCAFEGSTSLKFVKLSRNLEYIGDHAFNDCISLISIFILPSCTDIGDWAFSGCKKLIILSVPRQTELGENVIRNTALIRASPFEEKKYGSLANINANVNEWIKNLNQNEEYELHRACSSFNPLTDILYGIIKRKGPSAFQKKNELGLTPFDYLEANPFIENDIDQRALMKRYILELMGETV